MGGQVTGAAGLSTSGGDGIQLGGVLEHLASRGRDESHR